MRRTATSKLLRVKLLKAAVEQRKRKYEITLSDANILSFF